MKVCEENHFHCKICGGDIELDNPTDTCYSCQCIMINLNLGVKGF